MRIVYIDLDALNPSHLHCYGYPRKTSPHIDALAAEGTRFTNVHCSDAPCLPSRTSFYQGRFGILTGVVGHGGTAADVRRHGPTRGFQSTYELDAFPRQLQKLGFKTAMISSFGQRHAAHQYYAGFNEIHNQGGAGMESGEDVHPIVEQWLADHAASDQWYLHINYWDPHTPYRVPASYGNPFENEAIEPWLTDALLARHLKRAGPHSAQDLGMYTDGNPETFPREPRRITDMASLKQWMDGYDVGIHYCDMMVGQIIQKLKAAGVYDETAIIISADHGEIQGELGIYGEHGTADKATCNVPFIVKWPGAAAGRVDEGLRYHLDWAPTCMELLNAADQTPTIWNGRSFAGTLRGKADAGRDELILSQCAHVCQRSVRFGKWLYIRTYFDGFHPFPPHQLFDLAADPHEQLNVADAHPDVLREAGWRLARWHDEQMMTLARTGRDVTDPLWTVISEGGPQHAREFDANGQPASLRKYLQRLEATDRAEAADDLRRRYPHLA